MKLLFTFLFLCLMMSCAVPTVQKTQESTLDCEITREQENLVMREDFIPPLALGERKTLVILVNFQDNPTRQPYTPEHARNVTFNTVGSYFREVSYGKMWLSGDVVGWYTMPLNSTTCDKTAIMNAARQAAIDGGANLANYNHLIFAFPQISACPFAGSSSIAAVPARVWMNSDSYGSGTLAHEMGHGLGLLHSRSLECGPLVVGTSCSSNEYGDYFDLMGPGVLYHFNAYQKERIGWVNDASTQIVTGSGTYYIDAYETLGFGKKVLKILRSVDPTTGWRTWYYIEHRTPTGFDSGLSVYNVQNGVTFHTGTEGEGEHNYLLDMTPSTVSWYDSMLNVGQTYTDSELGVTFTVLTANNSQASIQITFGASTPVATASSTFTPSQTATSTPTPVDNQPPSVEVTYPPNNAVLVSGSLVTLMASATDSSGIADVEFYVGNTKVCTDTTTPYVCEWTAPNGRKKLSIYAKARDRNNNVQTSTKLIVTTKPN